MVKYYLKKLYYFILNLKINVISNITINENHIISHVKFENQYYF